VHKSLYDYFLSMSLYDDPDFRWDFSFTLYAEAEQFFLEKCFYVDYANRVFREHQSGTAAYKEVFDQLNPEKFNRKQIERVLPKSIYMPLDEFEEKEFFGAEYALHYLKDWEVKSWDSEIKLKVAEHEFTFSIGGNLSLLEQLKKITELEYPKDWLSAQNFPTLILKKFRNINTLAFQPGLNKEVTNKIMECKKLKVLRIHQGDYAAFSNLALNELRKSLTRLEVYFWTNEEPDWELLERLWDEWREKLLLGYREKAGTPIHFQTVLEYLQKSKLPRLFSNLKIFSPTDYYTPLHVVAQRRKMEAHKQIAELLVQHKADVNAKTNEGITPLQIVAQHGETQAHKQITELLVRHKADVNAIAKEGSTALHAVAQHGKTEAHKQIAELLVHNKADVNAIDDKKWTPLHFVAQHGKTEAHKQIAELLVQHEADVNAKNNQGITPLHAVARHAETQAHRQIAELLVQHKADIDAIDDKKWTPLHFVAAHGETEAHKQIVELLVQNKADVNAKTKAGFAPLHFVAQHGKTEAHKQIAELLVQHKADIDVIDDTKWTPLHFVAAYGETQAHKQIAELLLETAKQQGFLQKYLEIRDGHNNLKAIELARIFKQPLIIEVISKYMQS
ncbi:MAG: ankyrin repeat domain-containing protein, partial [Spirochaetota bacterium]